MKIRKGNSFEILYTSKIGNDVLDLTTVTALQVKIIHVITGTALAVDNETVGSSLRIKIGNNLVTGDYRLSVRFSYQENQFERDPLVFTIVPHVEQEIPLKTCTDIEIETIPVEDCVNGLGLPGINGKSAYEIWLQNGHAGTETDFIDFLKLHFSELTESDIELLQQPATIAAENITSDYSLLKEQMSSLIHSTTSAKDSAITAAENANNKANDANTAAENANNKASIADTAATAANEKGLFAQEQAERAELAANSIIDNWTQNW